MGNYFFGFAVGILITYLWFIPDIKHTHKELDSDGIVREYSAPNGYYDGEVLLPDYAHPDTLIVVDAKSLNMAMKHSDGSDGNISYILHVYCYSKSANLVPSRDYQVELGMDSTWIYDGNRLVGVIPYDSTSNFDNLMTKDNE